ncbi:MAG: hypothetical protein EZS28_051783, partial [Streblomastix strix]
YRSNYELKSNFVIALGTGGSNTSVWSPIGTGCGNSTIGLGQRSLIYAYSSGKSDKPATSNNLPSIYTNYKQRQHQHEIQSIQLNYKPTSSLIPHASVESVVIRNSLYEQTHVNDFRFVANEIGYIVLGGAGGVTELFMLPTVQIVVYVEILIQVFGIISIIKVQKVSILVSFKQLNVIFECKLTTKFVMSSTCTPQNDDNNWSPPPANKTDVSSLPVLANPAAFTFELNVFVPYIVQLSQRLTKALQISPLVKQSSSYSDIDNSSSSLRKTP